MTCVTVQQYSRLTSIDLLGVHKLAQVRVALFNVGLLSTLENLCTNLKLFKYPPKHTDPPSNLFYVDVK